jgi:outer membrane protein assembly factor BamB
MIVNDVVFAVGAGNSSTHAVLYALNPNTGKELYNSGSHINSFVRGGGMSEGGSQLYVGAADGTVYTFGFPMEH